MENWGPLIPTERIFVYRCLGGKEGEIFARHPEIRSVVILPVSGGAYKGIDSHRCALCDRPIYMIPLELMKWPD